MIDNIMKKITLFSLFFAFTLSMNGQTERKITLSSLLGSKTDTIGVVFLSDETPTLVGNTISPIADIRSIKAKGDTYKMLPVNYNAFRLKGFQVDYYGALALSEAGKMPELNRQNSQNEPKDFFRKALSFQNSVSAKFGFTKNEVIELAFGQDRTNNPVPHSNQNIYNALLKAEKLKLGKFTTDIGISGSSRENRLTNFGASHARLFNAVLTDNISQYPYRYLPDKSATKELLTYLKTNYRHKDFNTEASLSFNKQWDKRTMGFLPHVFASPLVRDEILSDLRVGLLANYEFNVENNNMFNFFANYSFNRTEDAVDRMNATVFDGFRNAHEIMYGVSYNYYKDYDNKIIIDLKNKHYFSNTVQNYTNFLPSAGIAIYLTGWLNDVLDDIFWNWNYELDNFKIFASAGKSLGEASLVYRNLAALTTEMNTAAALTCFYEDREIISQTKKMTPETYENYEVGFETSLGRRSWRSQYYFTYFNNTSRNMIAPRNDAGQFFLQNIGAVRNDGFLIEASYSKNFNRNKKLTLNVNFSRMRSKVLNIANGYEKVALAGFSDVGTYFAKGEPLGAIFGTTYQRNADGSIALDQNNLPIIDSELKKIGDPTSDFTIGFAPNLSWKKFDFSLNMEYNSGGDRWNGTRQFLENSPAKAAEDYIEDASCLRLSQVAASYNFIQNKNKLVRNLRVGILAQNLLVVSSYKGVDTATNLFGYTQGKGLDFFNLPTIRSYKIFVNIKF